MSAESELNEMRLVLAGLDDRVAQAIEVLLSGAGGGGGTGTPGSKWLSGTAVPSNILGINGDYYVRSNATLDVYGPKTGGAWGTVSFNLKGTPGADGASFTVNASGTFAERSIYNGQALPFSYLATDQNLLYFREGAAGGWSAGTPFGRGEPGQKGDDGEDGTDGREVEFSVSSTHIRTRYVGESAWTNLIALSELQGPPGQGGGSGVPNGGTTGQALLKNSNANGDAGWQSLPQAQPITETVSSMQSDDVMIILRDGEPKFVAASVMAGFFGSAPPVGAAPSAFSAGQWTATAGINEIVLNLNALPSDGGSAITSLQYRLDNGSWNTLAGTGTGSRTISGLNAQTYAVQLRAANSVGSGPASDTKNAVVTTNPTATAPDAFTAGQWTATAGQNQIEVNISALPDNGGSPITALQYRLDAGAWTSFAGTGTGSRTIAGLSAQAYTVTIRAVNEIGNGNASDVKTRTPTTAPVTTAPAAFSAGQWTVTPSESQMVINILSLPSNGGAAISALQYRLDSDAWTTLTGVGTGARTITGLAGATYAVQVRAVNSVGNGGVSDTKNATVTSAPTGPGELTYGSNSTDDGAMAAGSFNRWGTYFFEPGGESINIDNIKTPVEEREVAMISPSMVGLPIGATITSVVLNVNVVGRWMTPRIGISRVLRNVVMSTEAPQSPGQDNFAPGQAWEAIMGSGPNDIGPRLTITPDITANGPVAVPSSTALVASVQAWANGPRTAPLWLALDPGTDGPSVSIAGRNVSEVSDGERPSLTISYTS